MLTILHRALVLSTSGSGLSTYYRPLSRRNFWLRNCSGGDKRFPPDGYSCFFGFDASHLYIRVCTLPMYPRRQDRVACLSNAIKMKKKNGLRHASIPAVAPFVPPPKTEPQHQYHHQQNCGNKTKHQNNASTLARSFPLVDLLVLTGSI